MLDRTVELGEVLEALRGPAPGRPEGRTNPPPTPSPAPEQSDRPAGRPPDRPSGQKLEPTLENIRSIWSQVVQDARAKTPLLGSLLAETQVVTVDGRTVLIRPGNAVHAEGLERQREVIAQALGVYVSEAPRVQIAAGGAGGGGSERITPQGANAEAKDPTLSAAVDALDLELLE